MTRKITSLLPQSALCLSLLLLPVLYPSATAAQVCDVRGAIDATQPEDPGFEGLWRYSVTFRWNASNGLSHADVFLALQACECVCDPNLILFPDPAARSTGETAAGDSCAASYVGEYLCMGDPTIPEAMNSPAVKFDAVSDSSGCEPGMTGVGYAFFYSPLPPGPINSESNGIGMKASGFTCLGPIDGRFPLCDCTVQNEVSTCGNVKGIYR